MTCSNQDTQFGEILELVAEKGLNGISEPVTLLLNLAMRLERCHRHPESAELRPFENAFIFSL